MGTFNPTVLGARLLSAEESQEINLGVLQGFLGTWESKPGSGTGWNVIAVPGNSPFTPPADGFVLEVIPYYETWSFTPAVIAGNRGMTDEQTIVGLIYEQKVFSDCDTDFCNKRGFSKGTEIHAETGMLLNITNFDSGFNVARLGNIPHGNSILLMGNSSQSTGKFNFPEASTSPSLVDGGFITGYGEEQYQLNPRFPDFPQSNPNQQLANDVKDQNFGQVITLDLSSENATGGILNTPFITKNTDTTKMSCIFWLEEVLNSNGSSSWQLQYSQTINLVFPPSTAPNGKKFNWPHVDINTMQKVADI